uniref:Sphingomyelin phosphodiesterase 2 n=1 Tax=Caligus clemensi TaxID=344056 RepID=C1C159_CALCM|nr:Sphingomyelin phosphodiesterase 2 [Caligus clemensi]
MKFALELFFWALLPYAYGLETISPVGHTVKLRVYSLNNWAIPANPDKEQRLEELLTVLRNESFDVFLLQGLWMEYDHIALSMHLPKDLNITDFRELGSSTMCDGRITRAGCSGLAIVYRNTVVQKVSSSFDLFSYRGSIFTTDGTLGKGVGKLRLKANDFIMDVFNTHVHDSELYYQDLQTSELMSIVSKSPADVVLLGVSLQSPSSQKPYRNIMTYNPYLKVVNAGQQFDPAKWNDPEAYGTFNTPRNTYTPKGHVPSIQDFIFMFSPLKYDVSINNFSIPTFSSLSQFNVSLSNHETLGLNFECTV